MSLWDSFSDYVEREAERMEKSNTTHAGIKNRPTIKNAYNNRYSGNIKDWQIELIEEEARCRRIS